MSARKANPGDHWPGDGRYGVMCIEGYPDAAGSYDRNIRSRAGHGYSFHVVDTVMCGNVLATYKAQGETLQAERVKLARRRARKHAERLNAKDRQFDATH